MKLLAAPGLATTYTADAAKAAAASGHAELAAVVLKALVSQDMSAAVPAVADEQLFAAGVLRQWQAAEASIRELQARWPALQHLLVGICATHKQLWLSS